MTINRMLSWFPNTWRARYDAEVRDLLEAHPFGWRERRDLLRCCVDAWARQGKGWMLAAARVSLALGARVGLVVGVGWLCVKGVKWADPYVGASTWSASWAEMATSVAGVLVWFKIAAVLAIARYAIAPYARSGAAVDRPGWGQTIAAVLFLGFLQLLDPRSPSLGDVMFFGMVATMRYGRWLEFFGTPPRQERLTVLGLR